MRKAKLSRVIQCRMTVKDAALIKQYATRWSLSVSDYLRCAALAYGEGWEKQAVLEKYAKLALKRVVASVAVQRRQDKELKQSA